ncbi:MAG: hypothetical protein GY732_05395 [Gammaproteobacteria bacterium]|nr:hypothetical protein [Gammaproteobacteria bacterium]
MNKRNFITSSIILGLGLCAASGSLLAPGSNALASEAIDPIVASFEREFNHENIFAAPVQRKSIEHDELYKLLNPAHWTSTRETVRVLGACQDEYTDKPASITALKDISRSDFLVDCIGAKLHPGKISTKAEISRRYAGTTPSSLTQKATR